LIAFTCKEGRLKSDKSDEPRRKARSRLPPCQAQSFRDIEWSARNPHALALQAKYRTEGQASFWNITTITILITTTTITILITPTTMTITNTTPPITATVTITVTIIVPFKNHVKATNSLYNIFTI